MKKKININLSLKKVEKDIINKESQIENLKKELEDLKSHKYQLMAEYFAEKELSIDFIINFFQKVETSNSIEEKKEIKNE